MITIISSRIEGNLRIDHGTPLPAFWINWRASPAFLTEHGYKWGKDASGAWWVERRTQVWRAAEKLPPVNWVIRDSRGLLGHQHETLRCLGEAMTKYKAACDLSDTGTGKTYVAASLCRNLNFMPFVVCPLSVISSWRNILERFGVKGWVVNYESLKGKNDWGHYTVRWFPALVAKQVGIATRHEMSFYVSTFEEALYYAGVTQAQFDLRCPGKKKLCRRAGSFQWRPMPANVLMIFDEAHRCKGEHSINSHMMIAAKRYRTLFLTATLASTPRELKAAGFILGLHNLNNFDRWTESLGCFKNATGGWNSSGSTAAMAALYSQIIPEHGVRRRITEIPDFPKTVIAAQVYDMPEADAINKKYKAAVAEASKVHGAAVLGIMQKYRQWVELKKCNLLVELTMSYLEKGCAVVLFVNYTGTRLRLEKALEAPSIGGDTKEEERVSLIKAVAEDRIPVLICQIQAGGVGVSLHDITGKHPRVTLISPTFSAFDLKQALGRVHRSGGKTPSFQYIVYAAGTIEEDVCKAVSAKLNNLSALNDGDVTEKDFIQLRGRV